MKFKRTFAHILGFAFSAMAFGDSTNCFEPGNIFHAGPEVYYVERFRDGGTKQRGWMYGGRVGYDYLKRYKFYFGADALWASGNLKGNSGDNSRIRSTLTDANLESRFGYTLQCKHGNRFAFTPFVGYGRYWERNHFRKPTPRIVNFDNNINYVPIGFIMQVTPYENLTIGFIFKARYLLKGFIKAHDEDEEIGNFKMFYSHENHYRMDLPIAYRICGHDYSLFMSVDPFYEIRRYGELPNFPFDFKKTKFRLYGLNTSLVLVF